LSEKKRSVLDRLAELALAVVTEQAVRRSKERIYSFFRKVVVAVGVVVVGLVCLLLGLVYATVGLVKLVAYVVPEWAAFTVVGVALLAAGYLVTKLAFK
jgi:hypothetical protein